MVSSFWEESRLARCAPHRTAPQRIHAHTGCLSVNACGLVQHVHSRYILLQCIQRLITWVVAIAISTPGELLMSTPTTTTTTDNRNTKPQPPYFPKKKKENPSQPSTKRTLLKMCYQYLQRFGSCEHLESRVSTPLIPCKKALRARDKENPQFPNT